MIDSRHRRNGSLAAQHASKAQATCSRAAEQASAYASAAAQGVRDVYAGADAQDDVRPHRAALHPVAVAQARQFAAASGHSPSYQQALNVTDNVAAGVGATDLVGVAATRLSDDGLTIAHTSATQSPPSNLTASDSVRLPMRLPAAATQLATEPPRPREHAVPAAAPPHWEQFGACVNHSACAPINTKTTPSPPAASTARRASDGSCGPSSTGPRTGPHSRGSAVPDAAMVASPSGMSFREKRLLHEKLAQAGSVGVAGRPLSFTRRILGVFSCLCQSLSDASYAWKPGALCSTLLRVRCVCDLAY